MKQIAEISELVMEVPFRQFFGSNPQPMWIYDRISLQFLAVNDAAVARYGYSRERFLSMTLADIRPPEDRDSLRAAQHRLPHEGSAGIWRHLKADGSVILVEAIVHQIVAGGRPAVLGTPIDVSVRMQAINALRASEQRLRAITDNIPGIVFQRLRTPSGEVSHPYFSAAALEILDLTAEEAADLKYVTAAIHPDDRAALVRSVDQSAADLSIWSHQFRVRNRNGQVRWLHGRGTPRRLPTGDTLWDGIMMDLTDQKRAEQALEEREAELRLSREHLALAQHVAAIGSSEVDFRTGIWRWSDECCQIYGIDKASLSPMENFKLQLIHPDDRALYDHGFAAASRGEQPAPIEYRIVRPSGETRILYREAELLRDETGELTGAIATEKDITELRAAERQKEALQRQLWHLQRMEGLGTLAGGIAHDLNSTLVPVVAIAEFVRRGLPPDSPARAQLELIRDAGEHASELLGQLLTFSRRDVPERRPLDLASFLRHNLRLVCASVPGLVRVDARIADVPPVLADSGQIRQVLLNLVANAAQAIGDKAGTITIELAEGVPSDASAADAVARPGIRLSVVDTGCGMDDATQRRIFEPFFTTKSVGEGTGLGLSVVHGIVVSHHGRITVSSRPGLGARFDIYFPVPDPAEIERHREENAL